MRAVAAVLALITLVLPSKVLAAWTNENTAWEAAFVAATLVDWGQTRDLVRQPLWKDYHETNFILGEHPSVGRVDKYFGLCLIGHGIISWALPDPWRLKWQQTTGVGQVMVIIHNHGIGLRVDI